MVVRVLEEGTQSGIAFQVDQYCLKVGILTTFDLHEEYHAQVKCYDCWCQNRRILKVVRPLGFYQSVDSLRLCNTYGSFGRQLPDIYLRKPVIVMEYVPNLRKLSLGQVGKVNKPQMGWKEALEVVDTLKLSREIGQFLRLAHSRYLLRLDDIEFGISMVPGATRNSIHAYALDFSLAFNPLKSVDDYLCLNSNKGSYPAPSTALSARLIPHEENMLAKFVNAYLNVPTTNPILHVKLMDLYLDKLHGLKYDNKSGKLRNITRLGFSGAEDNKSGKLVVRNIPTR